MDEQELKNAKKKAMGILLHMDRTEHELYQKLKRVGYEEDIIHATVEFVKEYHYIDDRRYAEYYVELNRERKSRNRIRNELKKKGIQDDWIRSALASMDNDDIALQKAINKKTNTLEELTIDEKRKLAAALYRQGFRQEDICRKVLE